jgi:hypothetical protein
MRMQCAYPLFNVMFLFNTMFVIIAFVANSLNE